MQYHYNMPVPNPNKENYIYKKAPIVQSLSVVAKKIPGIKTGVN